MSPVSGPGQAPAPGSSTAAPDAPHPAPDISVIVPVLNEGPAVNLFLASLLKAAGCEKVEVILVDGDPRGGTLASIDPELQGRVIRLWAARGRARQMNAGAEAARGDILLFLHADTRLPHGAFARMRALLARPSVDAGAFSLRFADGDAFLALLARLTSWRSRLLREPFGDQAIFVRRAAFAEAGGFPELPLLEDVAFARRLRKTGRRLRILPDCVHTSARRFRAEGPVRCFLKDLAIYAAHALGIRPGFLKRWYPDQGEPRAA